MSVKRRVVIEDEEGENEQEAASASEDENQEDISESEDAEEADGENSDVSENDENAGTEQGNPGWADSIAKILKTNKPKGKKTLVLSKAKKLTDVKKDTSKYVGFETITETGEVKKEIVVEEKEPEKKDEEQGPLRKKRRELPNLRVKPNILEKNRERTFAKIATKGVVQLFNAVKMQQKDINKKLQEAGPLEVRKEKVLKSIDKRAFLDVLMGEKSQPVDEPMVSKTDTVSTVEKQKENSTWSVLRDDFMMSAKMKDWDKELEKEIESEDVEME